MTTIIHKLKFRSWLLLIALLFLQPTTLRAQSPNQIIQSVNYRFEKINDYRANVLVTCDIPSINVKPIRAKVIYKKPDKFRVKAEGILILPKQHADFMISALRDTTSFVAVKSGEEMVNGVMTTVINVIPTKDTADLILGKFWIDAAKGLVQKSQLTTRSQGTILIENFFGTMPSFGLPDKMIFYIQAEKFKLPKSLALDLGTSSSGSKENISSGEGKITLSFSNYVVNKGVTIQEFQD